MTDPDPVPNLILSGMMGSGKSRVGRLVADLLRRPFVDTDHIIERTAGRTIAQIFATDGEHAFRELERAAVREVAGRAGQVIALGGGVVMDPVNVDVLRASGEIVWIDPPITALVNRLSRSRKPGKRPLLAGEQDPDKLQSTLTKMRGERYAAYAGSASYILDTLGRPSDAIAQEVYAWACHHVGLLTAEERA